MNGTLVSIIVPAYNVEKYIDTCMESITRQIYPNLEILLINDGSTDGSYEKCICWEKTDERVHVFNKKNEGLGPTRNYGIEHASGKYVFFVDSDDWLPADAIGSMLDIAEKQGADVVSGDYAEYDSQTSEIREVHFTDFSGKAIVSDEDKKEYLMRGPVMVWCKLYRMDFLKTNRILMPATLHEDNAVFPIVVLTAHKIVCTSRITYFYRTNRSGSIVSNPKSMLEKPKACVNFLSYFKSKGLFEKYYPTLKRYAETRVWYAHEYYIRNGQMENDALLEQNRREAYSGYFGQQKPVWEYSFGLLGSFGSRYMVQQVGVKPGQLIMHYPFSSLIAQMTMGRRSVTVKNDNPFRMEKILADYRGELSEMLTTGNKLPDFMFVDFVEERYGVAKLRDGNYITLSDAWDESEKEGFDIERRIPACSEEYMDIWKEKCKSFVKLLKAVYGENRVILIKNRMAERYLDGDSVKNKFFTRRICACAQIRGLEKEGEINMQYYPDLDGIRKFNALMEEMENFFLGQYGGTVQTYGLPEEIYSSTEFKFGAEPQYMADEIYRKTAMKIAVNFDVFSKQ